MTRLTLPFDAWPAAHKAAWTAAMQPGGVFDDDGLASKWTEKTQRQTLKDYGAWLRHCKDVGTDCESAIPLTQAMLAPFIDELRARVQSETVCSRLRGLSSAYRVMWPDIDRSVIKSVISHLNRNAIPSRNKAARVLSSAHILTAALKAMEQARHTPSPNEVVRATWVRNGFMVAFLAIHPIRLANFTNIRIGTHLVLDADAPWLRFSRHETKEKREMTFPLAPSLHEPLADYLEHCRPVLLRGETSDALWISSRKTPIAEMGIYGQITKTTSELFGHSINPHMFRDCAMTTMAINDPVHIKLISRLLGHGSLKTGEKHYNQASMLSAVTHYQNALVQLRGDQAPAEPTP